METGSRVPGPVKGSPREAACPASEALAAYIDWGVGAEERAQIEAHLAECDECRLVFAHVLESHDGTNEEQVGPGRLLALPQPAPRRWKLRTLGAFVAAAAALLVVLQVRPQWWPGGQPGSVDTRLADLADAVGRERTVEARLTGAFRYGPLRASVRSGGSLAPLDNWKLFAAAGRIREDVQRDPTSGNLHALGLAHLLIGNYDDAVQAFEDAVAENAGNARYQSDLSAAYLARARQLDRQDDFPRALEAAERATKADAQLLEAKFNRALALQSLYLGERARRAWEEYLAIDSQSPWAEEARRHLAALQSSSAGPTDPARNNSPPPITDTTVEIALDWMLRQGLPAWADAVAADDSSRAASAHSSLTQYANQIAGAAGDTFPSALAALPSADDASARAAAASVKSFGRAMQLIDADEVSAAEPELRAGCGQATPAIAPLCDFELGMIDVLHRNDASAGGHAEGLARALQTHGSTYLDARLQRLEGYRALFRGDYAVAADRNHHSFELAERGKYLTLAGTMATQIADMFTLAGVENEAWQWRRKALSVAAVAQSPLLQLQTSMAAGWALSRSGSHVAARAFLSSETSTGLRRVPALITQAQAALANDDIAAASEAIDQADRVVAGSTDFRAPRVRTEILSLKAVLAARQGDVAAAERAFRDAIDAIGPERTAQHATLLLQRAGVRAAARSDLDAAERDIADAMDLIARSASTPQGAVIDPRVAQTSIAALISVKPDLQGLRGLAMSDALRELVAGTAGETPAMPTVDQLQALTAALPPERAAVVFLFDVDSLLTWVITRGTVQFLDRPMPRGEVERRVAALSVQIGRSVKQEIWMETLAGLHDLLLRDLPGIADARDLLVVADGPLTRVPFGSLVERRSGKFVFERTSIRFAPSSRSDFVTRPRFRATFRSCRSARRS